MKTDNGAKMVLDLYTLQGVVMTGGVRRQLNGGQEVVTETLRVL